MQLRAFQVKQIRLRIEKTRTYLDLLTTRMEDNDFPADDPLRLAVIAVRINADELYSVLLAIEAKANGSNLVSVAATASCHAV